MAYINTNPDRFLNLVRLDHPKYVSLKDYLINKMLLLTEFINIVIHNSFKVILSLSLIIVTHVNNSSIWLKIDKIQRAKNAERRQNNAVKVVAVYLICFRITVLLITPTVKHTISIQTQQHHCKLIFIN